MLYAVYMINARRSQPRTVEVVRNRFSNEIIRELSRFICKDAVKLIVFIDSNFIAHAVELLQYLSCGVLSRRRFICGISTGPLYIHKYVYCDRENRNRCTLARKYINF